MDEDLCVSDVALEDGELSSSSNDVYTPLQRPTNSAIKPNIQAEKNMNISDNEDSINKKTHLPEDCSDDKEDSDSSSSTGSMANISNRNPRDKPKKRIKRSMMVRLPPTEENQRARFKKYNIWTETLQEDTLTENLRNIEFSLSRRNDRNVENYDYSQKYHLDGGNSLKRRFKDSSESSNEEQERFTKKRVRYTNKKSRSTSREQSDDSNASRHIADLSENILEMEVLDLAREIAEKLLEDKYDLIVRIIEVVGKLIPIELYKRAQAIEADGGMLIKNRRRRRTPGGVFLFLLKNDDRLTDAEKKLIFKENPNTDSNLRERKVQELKERLCKQKSELPPLRTRTELLYTQDDDMFSIDKPVEVVVPNPPPSPAGNE